MVLGNSATKYEIATLINTEIYFEDSSATRKTKDNGLRSQVAGGSSLLYVSKIITDTGTFCLFCTEGRKGSLGSAFS